MKRTFITHTRNWLHSDGSAVKHIYIMESTGISFAVAYVFDDHVEVGDVSVDEEFQHQGIATEMLNILDANYPELRETGKVYVEVARNCPDWLCKFYSSRGYFITRR